MEVDNWQFAWAEEQKKACCKTVGLGSPGREMDIGGVNGRGRTWMDVLGASKRKKHLCFFFTICLLDFFMFFFEQN